jgi:dipeptidyl aminopeptidase/acylaminoacyl peptidase
MIQAWLATPDGHGPFPTIVHIHGGPEMVMTDSYSPESQMWLDHGFAFITVNYRGSTTFGRDFLEKIWFNPGTWELEDLVAARDYVVREGIADPEKVFLSGWSYGGYLTLYGLGVRPDLWAGGMAGVAVADWVSQYEDESEAMRAGDRAFFGGPPEEKMEAYVKASPITYVDRLQAPVLIIQGNNDTRCPARQIELYKAKAKEFGKWVEVHWFDAGHARLDTERLIQHHELMLQFACRIVG